MTDVVAFLAEVSEGLPEVTMDCKDLKRWLYGDVPKVLAEIEQIRQAEMAASGRSGAGEVQTTPFGPEDWDNYIGQHQMKAHLRVRIASAVARGAKLPPTLLLGPAGAGKTTLAKLIAAELGRPLHVLAKPVGAAELCDVLWRLGRGGVLFVDEIHNATAAQHEVLMQLLEDGAIDGPRGRAEFDVSVIAATTEKQLLKDPLLSRFEIKPRFVEYTTGEMAEIVCEMADQARVDFDAITGEFCEALGKAAAGTPRNARALVMGARDLTLAGIEVTAEAVLAFCDVAPDGLSTDHLAYLRLLGNQPRGQAGESALATLLSIDRSEVRRIERLLVQRGYVLLTGTGRFITEAGRLRVRQ